MDKTDVEVIDLTGSTPKSPTLPTTRTGVRSLRKQKRPHTDLNLTQGAANETIIILDGDEEPSSVPSSGPEKKRRTRKKRKKPLLPENEIADDAEDGEIVQLPREGQTTSSSSLFYLDDKPDTLPEASHEHGATSNSMALEVAETEALLLLDHVTLSVAQNNSVALKMKEAAMIDSDTDDFIHFADAELNLFTRYYEEQKDDHVRKAHLVCGQCGAEGDHRQADCPVVVCLTCGAHNEHSTRQCPIVKTCFSCGMKGHINKDCPNKFMSRQMTDRYYDCSRCGSILHKTRECPTLWRMYDYMDDTDRDVTLKMRREKENLPVGQGGEGYIGEDYWCYNCGASGHLGDDCHVEPLNPDAKEPSAFGSYNTMSGPFADKEFAPSDRRKLRREWELKGNFDDGYGFAGPSDVGKRGRDKERNRMRRREKETQEVDDVYDGDDWFGSRQRSETRQRLSQNAKRGEPTGKIVLKLGSASGSYKDEQRPADRLLDRISDHAKRDSRVARIEDRRSASPSSDHTSRRRRQDDALRRERGQKGDRERGDRNRARDKGRDEGRHRERYIQNSEGNAFRQRVESKKRDQDKSGRQYYGGYAR
ncbi:uncharacterized protein FOMMEDRAFT_147876 [Fomitiporia mediterranea MF3/22]|uniref:uncharacterized protein n=1 Tax=Fomitiporia mediterranea (strain MF3/22) TaxID=694068 RepID=UPI00044077F7|nr:uncharacterized protein FOMMEDRAFT_147876 [Fomitiporia mediterranea MF3/22]EJD01316.1 hypothetical protein FOMMEDRAFT_147876 [Fomitiporia mediterranea MF3/22]